MRGRKPTNIITGDVVTVPKAPAWLSKEAQAEWRRVMPELVKRGVLTQDNLGSVENYCVACGHVRQLERLLTKAFDPKIFRMQDQAIKTARQIAAEVGLTPVSRSRPSVRNDDSQDDDENPLNVS